MGRVRAGAAAAVRGTGAARGRPARVPSPAPTSPAGTVRDGLLQLQRDAGNGAVTSLLRPGAKGPQVVELQQLLNRGGLVAPVPVDGSYGRKTKAAVRHLQQVRHLHVDGIAGADTWQAAQAAVDEAGAAARAEGAAKRAGDAWQLASAAHTAGEWSKALQAYAEVVDQAATGGRDDLRTAAVARMREARLHRRPTPFADLLTKAMDEGTEEEQQKAEAPAVQVKRTKADALSTAGQHAAALALYQEVYAASNAQSMSDLWSIATCLHALGRFDEALSWYRQVAAAEGGQKDETFAMIATERMREAGASKPPTPSKQLIAAYMDNLEKNDGIAKADPDRARLQALGSEADGLYDGGRYAEALAKYRAVMAGAAKFDLALSTVRYNAGMCLLRLEQWSAAAELFAQARDGSLGMNWVLRKLPGSSDLATETAEVRTKASERIAQALHHQRP